MWRSLNAYSSLAMDTPDKKIQPSPSSLFSKFEDSPVFNYLSTLSPIRTFNLSNSGQSFHLFNFASPPSALTSPLNNCSKDSKITRAIVLPDEPKNNNSQNGIEDRSAGTLSTAQQSDVHDDEVGKFGSGGEATVSTSDGSLKLVIELPRSLKYEAGSPENNVSLSDSVKPETESNVVGTEMSSAELVQSVTAEAESSFENDMGEQRIQMEQNKEICDWDKFIDEASNILITPAKEKHQEELDDKSVDSGTLSFVATVLQPPNDFDDIKKIDSVFPSISSEDHDMDTPLTKSGAEKTNEANLISGVKSCAILTEEVVRYSGTEQDDKRQKMTRRRCLVYEMSGTHYRKLLDSSPISKPSVSPNTSKEKRLVASKPASNRFSSLLPGIGLHLNAIAATSKDKIIVKRQTLTCRRQLISSPRAITSIDLPNSETKSLNTPTSPNLAGSDRKEQKDEVQTIENACHSSAFGEDIEFPQSSPKRKRRKPESVGDGDSCKRCNCKRSKCLKLYCECFAAGLYCVDSCNCQECFNKPIHEETVLETRRQIESRNPLAFAPKVIRCSSTANNGDELKKTPASARHKRGCNCKKSGCLKKYCECFQGGVGCSMSCRCEGCKNTFGQKEGPEGIAIFREAQMPEPEESTINVSSYNGVSETDVAHQDEVPPEPSKQQDQASAKPCKQSRQPLRQPFLFNGMTPQYPPIANPPPLQPCENRVTNNPDESDCIEDLKIAPEDETPEILKGDYLLPTCVKSASPNCKRVSSPHCHDFETSPGWRSCRKLILRSIP